MTVHRCRLCGREAGRFHAYWCPRWLEPPVTAPAESDDDAGVAD